MSDVKQNGAGVAVYRALCVVAAAIAFVIVTGTVYAFIAPSLSRGKPVYTVPAREKPIETPAPADNIFTGMGKIRAITADKEARTVVVAVAFPFDKDDAAFMEELAGKIADFRSITAAFFRGCTAADLRAMGEGGIKAGLLQRYNATLKLGQIPALYFNDFMVIE